MVRSDKIYQGNSRSFDPAFAQKFWRDHKDSVCAKCKKPIDPGQRSIDHKTAWSTVSIGLETETVCKNGTHWEVVLQKTMMKEYQRESNLVPMHKSCNSSKSGPRGNDSIGPQKLREKCPGKSSCPLRKAP